MARRKLSKAELKIQRQEFVSGTTGTAKQEVHLTEFEKLISGLGLSVATCHYHPEVQAWVSRNRNLRYVPEIVLHRLGTETTYDGEPSAYTVVEGVVIPEQRPLEEVEAEDVKTQAK